jgi:hypothetical protein
MLRGKPACALAEEELSMSRNILIGAVSGLSLVLLGATPSLAIDALMLPNSQNGTTAYTYQYAPLRSSDTNKDTSGSVHFSVSGDDGRYHPGGVYEFGPNSDSANPLGPMPTYGPPREQHNGFFPY